MDMRKFGSAFIKPDDVRDGPREERIVNVYESDKYNCPVLDLESGDQISLNNTNVRTLCKAWGVESDDWIGQTVQLELGYYSDWRKDPPEQKETVVVRAISTRQPSSGDDGAKPLPPPTPRLSRSDLDDEIPF